jgi:hypothetical protein
LRITVADVLTLLAAGQSSEDILHDYAYLEDAHIDAALAFAAHRADHPRGQKEQVSNRLDQIEKIDAESRAKMLPSIPKRIVAIERGHTVVEIVG